MEKLNVKCNIVQFGFNNQSDDNPNEFKNEYFSSKNIKFGCFKTHSSSIRNKIKKKNIKTKEKINFGLENKPKIFNFKSEKFLSSGTGVNYKNFEESPIKLTNKRYELNTRDDTNYSFLNTNDKFIEKYGDNVKINISSKFLILEDSKPSVPKEINENPKSSKLPRPHSSTPLIYKPSKNSKSLNKNRNEYLNFSNVNKTTEIYGEK